MRYIKKHFDAATVVQHEQELKDAHLDKASLIERQQTEELNNNDLYKQVRSIEVIPHWKNLQDQLNKDQGGVCCYCGAKLCYPDSQHYSVEHVSPRDPNIELVGEYENLLLSCHSSNVERGVIKTTVLRRKDRHDKYHCDEAKGNKILHYTPLQQDCASHFTYQLNGEVNGNDNDAENDINTLNLNCQGLTSRRLELLLSSLYEGNNVLPVDVLRKYRDEVIKRDANNNHREFYFVLADVIEHLLSLI
jgi:uncharacterized protein (TIGR02646 family)